MHEESHIESLRNTIVEQYKDSPTGCGSSFGEILCYEQHSGKGGNADFDAGGLTYLWLAKKWGIPVSLLGSLIKDHCDRLEEMPIVDHSYAGPE